MRKLQCPDDGPDIARSTICRCEQRELKCWFSWVNSHLHVRLWRELRWHKVTLNMFTDANRRPPVPRDPIPPELLRHVPVRPVKLDTDRLCRNLRSSLSSRWVVRNDN